MELALASNEKERRHIHATPTLSGLAGYRMYIHRLSPSTCLASRPNFVDSGPAPASVPPPTGDCNIFLVPLGRTQKSGLQCAPPPTPPSRVSLKRGLRARSKKRTFFRARSTQVAGIDVCTAYPNLAKTTQHQKMFAKIPNCWYYMLRIST